MNDTRMAPAPSKGMQRHLFALLQDMGDDWTERDEIIELCSIVPTDNQTKARRTESLLVNMAATGFLTYKKHRAEKWYKIATYQQFMDRQNNVIRSTEQYNIPEKAPQPERRSTDGITDMPRFEDLRLMIREEVSAALERVEVVGNFTAPLKYQAVDE